MAPLLPLAWVVLTHASRGLASGTGDAQFPNPVTIEHEGEAAGAAVIVVFPIGVEAGPVLCLGHASDGHPSLSADELPITPAADGLVPDKAAPLVVDDAVLREEREERLGVASVDRLDEPVNRIGKCRRRLCGP